jgi:very-short-patch-repair endonuclease
VGLPEPVPEFRFAPPRRWRIDWAWPDQRVGLEVDGGVWVGGRHTRGAGWLQDTEKLNAAAALGWRMLRCTPQQLASGAILEALTEALGVRPTEER